MFDTRLRNIAAKLTGKKLMPIYASVIVGLCSGLAALLLKFMVHGVADGLSDMVEESSYNALYFFLTFLGIFLTSLFTRFVICDDINHGVAKVLKARAKNHGILPAHAMYSPVVGCTLTVGFGGSAGMEAPVMHAGSAIGSNVARLFRFDTRTRTILVGAGAAAAVASIFKAPIAGIVFALEVLMLDSTIGHKLPLIVAAVTGTLVSRLASGGGAEFSFTLSEPFKLANVPWYLGLGLCCGLFALYLQRMNKLSEKLMAGIRDWRLRAAIGGIILGSMILALPPLFGEGFITMKALLSGRPGSILSNTAFSGLGFGSPGFFAFLLAVLVLKPFATGVTTGSGGIGGVFAPSLFMGSLCGYLFAAGARLLGAETVSVANFTLVGMAAFLAALMHAPLTGVFLIAEITGGYQLLIPLMVAVLPAYAVHRSFSRYSIYTENLAAEKALVTHDKDAAALMRLELGQLVESDYKALAPDDTLAAARETVLASERFVEPVLGEHGSLLGLLGFDDIKPTLLDPALCATSTVYDRMSRAEPVCLEGLGAEALLKRFKDADAAILPVEDQDGKFIGFIRKGRLLEAYRDAMLELTAED